MLLAIFSSNLSFWAIVVVCCIVALLLFVKVVKFWLKAVLVIGLIFLVGKCYFGRKTNTHRSRTSMAYHLSK